MAIEVAANTHELEPQALPNMLLADISPSDFMRRGPSLGKHPAERELTGRYTLYDPLQTALALGFGGATGGSEEERMAWVSENVTLRQLMAVAMHTVREGTADPHIIQSTSLTLRTGWSQLKGGRMDIKLKDQGDPVFRRDMNLLRSLYDVSNSPQTSELIREQHEGREVHQEDWIRWATAADNEWDAIHAEATPKGARSGSRAGAGVLRQVGVGGAMPAFQRGESQRSLTGMISAETKGKLQIPVEYYGYSSTLAKVISTRLKRLTQGPSLSYAQYPYDPEGGRVVCFSANGDRPIMDYETSRRLVDTLDFYDTILDELCKQPELREDQRASHLRQINDSGVDSHFLTTIDLDKRGEEDGKIAVVASVYPGRNNVLRIEKASARSNVLDFICVTNRSAAETVMQEVRDNPYAYTAFLAMQYGQVFGDKRETAKYNGQIYTEPSKGVTVVDVDILRRVWQPAGSIVRPVPAEKRATQYNIGDKGSIRGLYSGNNYYEKDDLLGPHSTLSKQWPGATQHIPYSRGPVTLGESTFSQLFAA